MDDSVIANMVAKYRTDFSTASSKQDRIEADEERRQSQAPAMWKALVGFLEEGVGQFNQRMRSGNVGISFTTLNSDSISLAVPAARDVRTVIVSFDRGELLVTYSATGSEQHSLPIVNDSSGDVRFTSGRDSFLSAGQLCYVIFNYLLAIPGAP